MIRSRSFGGWASRARFIVTETTPSLREGRWSFTSSLTVSFVPLNRLRCATSGSQRGSGCVFTPGVWLQASSAESTSQSECRSQKDHRLDCHCKKVNCYRPLPANYRSPNLSFRLRTMGASERNRWPALRRMEKQTARESTFEPPEVQQNSSVRLDN
jgi:hypothetical protein